MHGLYMQNLAHMQLLQLALLQLHLLHVFAIPFLYNNAWDTFAHCK